MREILGILILEAVITRGIISINNTIKGFQPKKVDSGPDRDLNPGPVTASPNLQIWGNFFPEATILPLDHQAVYPIGVCPDFFLFNYMKPSNILTLRHPVKRMTYHMT